MICCLRFPPDLDFEHPQDFSLAAVDGQSPLAAPSPIPEIFGAVLVIFDAHNDTFARLQN